MIEVFGTVEVSAGSYEAIEAPDVMDELLKVFKVKFGAGAVRLFVGVMAIAVHSKVFLRVILERKLSWEVFASFVSSLPSLPSSVSSVSSLPSSVSSLPFPFFSLFYSRQNFWIPG